MQFGVKTLDAQNLSYGIPHLSQIAPKLSYFFRRLGCWSQLILLFSHRILYFPGLEEAAHQRANESDDACLLGWILFEENSSFLISYCYNQHDIETTAEYKAKPRKSDWGKQENRLQHSTKRARLL